MVIANLDYGVRRGADEVVQTYSVVDAYGLNTFVGRNAGNPPVSDFGNRNTAIGVDAIPGVDVGDGNSAIGGESGYTERGSRHPH